MLTEVKKTLNLIAKYFCFNLSASMEYRTSFIIQTFGMIINNASFIFFWWILFENVESIGGYGFKEVMMLWAISSVSYGISFVLFGNIRRITHMIVNGELDPYLLQPKDVLINIISSSTVVSAWGDILYGIILFIGINGVNLADFLLFLFFCTTGALIFSSVLILVNSLTFYMGNSQGISGLVLEFMITFSIYPEGIYKGVAKYIIYTIIPAAFISLVPVRLLQYFSFKWFLVLLFFTAAWIIFAYWFFYKGLKKYESGNLIVNKL
ncbi:ABC-2 type transport system permease protein [Proteiniborus ethanoligenes]|uniref:ABC-2 type transport system permease protein n=1 Tax=Proteiniborus ethanoligenes TaxID=415015 RepID=A0A1H3LGF0_9FIRM|nr:ABC-2 family transporter protein [Proteiniborus ethanoligenes]SDY63028.1 ABC-2 type transport system permease protein [Proteiniborus ethanoligenes]